MDVYYATPYQLRTEPRVGVELSRVRSPDDAAEFVRRFGMLTQLPSLDPRELSTLRSPLRERYAVFEKTAFDLHIILETMLAVRRGNKGDAQAINQLHEWCSVPEDQEYHYKDPSTGEARVGKAGDFFSPAERNVGVDDRAILTFASEYAAQRVNKGLQSSGHATLRVFDRAHAGEANVPGAWRIGLEQATLLTACYLSVALVLVDQEPIGICAEQSCQRVFFVTDGRQRFCTATCANRARFKRYKARHGGTGAASTEGK